MTKDAFNNALSEKNWFEIFRDYGWNNPSTNKPLPLTFGEDEEKKTFSFTQVAQCHVRVYVCEVESLPKTNELAAIDSRLRKNNSYGYITIYVDKTKPLNHLWVVPVQLVDKRTLVKIAYDTPEKANVIHTKLEEARFEIGREVNATEAIEKINKTFAVNAARVTKQFYAEFRKEHNAFVKGILNITDAKDRDWYASVMLNRLMFCYFIQKKGFLDDNTKYLRDKLNECQGKRGRDKFYGTFYRAFLRKLFTDGLNSPKHSSKFEDEFGLVPYLNGGMFDEHELEKRYLEIDVPDEIFERLFDFFDKWNWHLDTTVTATGRDINPDVLGYIFEQYINDRAAMGAYYTKEDITDYIGKNCIIPFLFDRLAESPSRDALKPGGNVWQHLQASGERYVYDAVKKGYTSDWKTRLPGNIARGIDAKKPNLLERRADWNSPADAEFALPTEIWRETIERLTRCEKVIEKIFAGDITSINDFITENLNIRAFAQDLIAETSDHNFVRHFYHALRQVTILDPTCGSGAFLFAALNILEPLYEECISRMMEFHAENKNLFKEELGEIESKYRSNIQYFIYKSIILRNLYGVDIMVEATEIAKLRLFLKLVAVVDVDMMAPNLGLDPLPDIDFNIRCGNTLVGYATEKELEDSLTYGDMFEIAEFKGKVTTAMQTVAAAYRQFKDLQMTQESDMKAFKAAKEELRKRLAELNDTLNARLYGRAPDRNFQTWLASHQPFHWLAEFYEIIHDRGGFDVIIGNPPYVSISSISYLKINANFKCSDLYAYVIKRVFALLFSKGRHGFVVMHNLAFSRNFTALRLLFAAQKGSMWFSFFSRIPSGLFSGDVRVRNCIYIFAPQQQDYFTTHMHRWFNEQRDSLFSVLQYSQFSISDIVPMLGNSKLQPILMPAIGDQLSICVDRMNGKPLYFKQVAYNWLAISNEPPPAYDRTGKEISQTMIANISVKKEFYEMLMLLFAGKLYLCKWLAYGDDFHLTTDDLISFRFPFEQLTSLDKKELHKLYKAYVSALPATVQFKLNAGKRVGTYNTMKLWGITEQSDRIFMKYLTSDIDEAFQLIENQVAKSVVSVKHEDTSDEI